jgi:Peptidase A4 family
MVGDRHRNRRYRPSVPQGGTAHAGDDIVAVTDTQSNPGSVGFNVYDLTTSATWGTSRSLNGQSASPATAEVIAERPSVNGSPTPLSNFGTLSVPFAAAAQGGIAQNLGNYATTQINMTANGLSGDKALATPVKPSLERPVEPLLLACP